MKDFEYDAVCALISVKCFNLIEATMILLSEQTYLQLHCLFAIACDSYKAFKCNEPTHFSVMHIPAGPSCSRHYGDIIRSPYLSLPPPCPQFNTSNSLHRSAPSTPPGICDAHWIIDIKTCPTTTPPKKRRRSSQELEAKQPHVHMVQLSLEPGNPIKTAFW